MPSPTSEQMTQPMLELLLQPMLEPLLEMPVFPAYVNYELTPKGFQAPELKRAVSLNSISKLEVIFEEWVKSNVAGIEQLYDFAETIIKDIDCSLDDINFFLINNQDQLQKGSDSALGFLISALYNKLPDKVIIYNLGLETPLNFLGLNLAVDKTLIITDYVNLGDYTGAFSKGIIAVSGDATMGEHAGFNSKGILFFTGNSTIGNYAARDSKGITIATGNTHIGEYLAERFSDLLILGEKSQTGAYIGKVSKKTIIAAGKSKFGSCYFSNNLIDLRSDHSVGIKLNSYLTNFSKIFTGTKEEIEKKVAALGANPKEKVKKDIGEILEKCGYTIEGDL